MKNPEKVSKKTFDKVQDIVTGDDYKSYESTDGSFNLAEKWPWLLLLIPAGALLYGLAYLGDNIFYTESMGSKEQFRMTAILGSSLWALILGGVGVFKLVRMRVRKRWPTSRGMIIQSTITRSKIVRKKASRTYLPLVVYTYEIDGKQLAGDKVFYYGGGVTSSRASKLAARYPAKTEADIYYNPKKPEVSVLEPDRITTAVGFFLFSGLLLVVIAIMAFYSYGPFA